MRALITGITGQDGQYLAELLHSKGYEVYGLVRGQSNPKMPLMLEKYPYINYLYGDLTDFASVLNAISTSKPDEIYNLAAISFVGISWSQAELTGDVTGLGVLRVLEACKAFKQNSGKDIRVYQASSSEIFGKVREVPQTELTPFHPRSPYGAAKAFGHYITVNYRESHGLFACSGILFNHESPRRGSEFVTRKITKSVAEIANGTRQKLQLGNIDARRDWGFAGDYVYGMWLMLQQDTADDYVLATGVSHSVRDILDIAFNKIGITDWSDYVEFDKSQIRPAEVDSLIGDFSKAKQKLGWQPVVNFEELISMMVEHDLNS
jgi:GDPmannose 4,6-dehydratase